MKYRLKKDLPGMKAGEIFTECTDETELGFYVREPKKIGEVRQVYHYEYVINSDWFEPIEERIELQIHNTANFEGSENGVSCIVFKKRLNEKYFEAGQMVKMEQAINGELFTKKDMIDFIVYFRNRTYLPQSGELIAQPGKLFNDWLKDKQNK